jgi:hypothetical protein
MDALLRTAVENANSAPSNRMKQSFRLKGVPVVSLGNEFFFLTFLKSEMNLSLEGTLSIATDEYTCSLGCRRRYSSRFSSERE